MPLNDGSVFAIPAAFVPQIASPAINTGLFGLDKGALVPGGIAIGGVPVSPTPDSGAFLVGGPAGTFPPAYNYGYTELKYSVDGGPFSAAVLLAGMLTVCAEDA